MDALTQHRMSADDFIAWSIDRPDGKRFELVDGEIFEMASERSSHALVKARVCRCLEDAMAQASLIGSVYPDGMAVRIGAQTVYEPDAAIRLGPPLDQDATHYSDPVLVVEILSPSTRNLDVGLKLADYFTLPSLRHYLVMRTDRRAVVHHRRGEADAILTAIVTSGSLRLDPPGITLDVASLFP